MCHNLWAERQVSHQKSWIKQDLHTSKSTDIPSLLFILTSMRREFSKRADIGSVYNASWRSSWLHFKRKSVQPQHALSITAKAFSWASDCKKRAFRQSCCIMMFCRVILKLMIWVCCQRETRDCYRRMMTQVWSFTWTLPNSQVFWGHNTTLNSLQSYIFCLLHTLSLASSFLASLLGFWKF